MYRLEQSERGIYYEDTDLGIRMDLPMECEAELVQTPDLPAISDEEVVITAIQNPVSGEKLSHMASERRSRSACILISDATRAVPTSRLAREVVNELVKGGVQLSEIHFFVAIGVHRPATEEEMACFLGDLYGKVNIENHTPFDPSNLIYLGETCRGTPIHVNKRAYCCDLHIQIGKVEPHEFAGYSGGRKSVLPGISSEQTIRINHRPEMILNPKSVIGNLDENPVHEDMLETAEAFRIDFAVNCILNRNLELAAIFAGGLKEGHSAAVRFVRDKLSVKIKRPDIIVTTPGQPLDIDFYQSVKTLIALTEVLDESTTVILTCGCREGVNSEDMLRAFRSSKNLEETIQYTVDHYQIQMDHVLLLSKILRKGVQIIVSCPNVDDSELRDMFMIPCKDSCSAIDVAIAHCAKSRPKLLFYPAPQTGLPELN